MKELNIKQIIKQFIKATNAFDVETALKLFSDKVVIDDVSVGEKFKGLKGVRNYLETFFVGYKTVSKLESVDVIDKRNALAQIDFTGNFGHETGGLKFTFNEEGLIIAISAHLD